MSEATRERLVEACRRAANGSEAEMAALFNAILETPVDEWPSGAGVMSGRVATDIATMKSFT